MLKDWMNNEDDQRKYLTEPHAEYMYLCGWQFNRNENGTYKYRFKYKNERWRATRHRWILECSTFSPEWWGPNKHVHEVAIWVDGTAIFAHHGTLIGIMFVVEWSHVSVFVMKVNCIYTDVMKVQLLETSAHYLSNLSVYHSVTSFPHHTYWGDIQALIKYVKHFLCIHIIYILVAFVANHTP